MPKLRTDIQCKYCKEMSGRKQGKVKTLTQLKQRYICKNCGRSWYGE